MQKTVKYTIFKTKWGYFGLAATGNGLLRTCLPLSSPEKVKRQILRASFVSREPSIENRASSIEFDKALFKSVQEQITAYFEGARINFRAIPIVLACPERPVVSEVEPSRGDGLGVFAKRVLTACRDIEFGRIVTYGRLAELAGKPGAARAVGGVLAKNPLPLIIPCHRVICANGSLGGFSALGGTHTKSKLIELEKHVLTQSQKFREFKM
jgi:methylated-DNA-[protein]-cysteine S-methyltransferase